MVSIPLPPSAPLSLASHIISFIRLPSFYSYIILVSLLDRLQTHVFVLNDLGGVWRYYGFTYLLSITQHFAGNYSKSFVTYSSVPYM